jgi:hypothetical protein
MIGKSEMTGKMPAAEKATPAARECERRNKGGTGQGRRECGAPKGADHGPISCAFIGRWERHSGST